MRVAVYDKNPGEGFGQYLLAISWLVGCFLHKLFGKLDDYHGAMSWDDAFAWLESKPELTSVQYWGHGSPGTVWPSGEPLNASRFLRLNGQISPDGVVWFRTCSTFSGRAGYEFSKCVSEILSCTVAGHTRIIGLFHGGLHTRKPYGAPSWSINDGEFNPSIAASLGMIWGNNTVLCLRATIPKGW